MIVYYKLWDYLRRHRMSKISLLNCISSPTLAKLSKNQVVTTSTIDKICTYLDVDPGDIMEYMSV